MDEMAEFWRCLEHESFKGLSSISLRLIIAKGGVRITEVLHSKKDWWLDNGNWRTMKAPKLTLPKAKNGFPHDLPVTRHGKKLVDQARALSSENPIFLFPDAYDRGKPRPIESLSRPVAIYCTANGINPFTLRDLRRSMKNMLLDNDVPQAEVDIWHNQGRNADVARRNDDRSQYEHAKKRVRTAIDRLVRQWALV